MFPVELRIDENWYTVGWWSTREEALAHVADVLNRMPTIPKDRVRIVPV